MAYINEAFLYHLHRTDTRHNFAPYFYLLYLSASNMQLSRLISFCAFIPQASIIIWFAFRYVPLLTIFVCFFASCLFY